MRTATIVMPRDIAETADVVREAASARHVVLATGTNSKRSWTRVPERVDVELSTRDSSGIVAYEPGDGVITALAGTPWGDLERAASAHGHHLSPWIHAADEATVGGVVAAGQSGADRLRFGPLRHHVLGMHVVDGEGRVVKSGGRLVKNVTGFDLQRLHTGAHGTLGVIAEVSLRLHAAPELRAIGLGHVASRTAALTTARAVLARNRSLWNVLVTDMLSDDTSDRRWSVAVLAAGLAEAVEDDVRALRAAAPELPWQIGERGTDRETRVLGTWRGISRLDGMSPTLRVSSPPSRLDMVLGAFDVATTGLETRTWVQPGLGCLSAWIRDVDATAVARITAEMMRARADVHWRGLDDALRSRVDLFGPTEPAGIALMRRLKAALDPRGTFATGRLAGGL